jgi:transcriptional regulator with XRE-family HTH domain
MVRPEQPLAPAPPLSGRSSRDEQPEPPPDPTAALGANLRRLRLGRRLSLEGLSRASGVSRAMLSQVELGKSAPTINLLWKIARALGVPFSSLLGDGRAARLVVLRASASKVLASQDGAFTTRALFPNDGPRTVEFYELRLAPGSLERADPHPPDTTENLVVTEGSLTVALGGERHRLEPGDAIFFYADMPHEYLNEGAREARACLVMTYERAERRPLLP